MKGDEISFKLGNFLLNSLYKISLGNYYTKFIEIPKIPQIYYRISYTKNQDFANLMKIIGKKRYLLTLSNFLTRILYQKSSGFFLWPRFFILLPEKHSEHPPFIASPFPCTKKWNFGKFLGLLHELLIW